MVDTEAIVVKCFITYVETVNNLFKVWFQRDDQGCLAVEDHLNDLYEDLQFGGYGVRENDELSPDLICFGKFEDGKYYRIKIIEVLECSANVFFIDYGNETILKFSDIRVYNQNVNAQIARLLQVTPLASSAFLNNVNLIKPLSEEQITNLRQNLMYTYKLCTLNFLSLNLCLIDIHIDKRSLSQIIIDSGLGISITDAELVSRIQSMMNPIYQQDNQKMTGRSLVSHRLQVRNKTQPTEVSTPKVTFQCEERQTSSTSNTLPIGSTYNAHITHVEDGPYSFTIQLKSFSEEIQPNIEAMCNRNPPRLNNTPLSPGSLILGRSRTDNKFRRAVVMNVKSNSCKVYYLDYGTTEELPQSEIYILPQAIRDLAQPQAMGFCLANLQSVSLPESCKDVFAKLVLNKQVLFRVTQNELASLTQCCEMFLDGKNVRDVLLNITLPLEYTSQSPPRGREVEVNVSFVDCPSQFFVQYHSEIRILGIIQDALAAFCPNQERLQSMSQISIGTPVASLYNFDNMWYRALVIGIEDDSVNVLYVDYGNRDNVRVDQLCYLSRELVTKWRTQAVECCLIGFENATPDSILAQEMENKVLGGHFTLKLQCLLSGSRFVGDLIDEGGESVVKMMNDLAKTLSQASPTPTPGVYQSPPAKFQQSSNAYGSQPHSFEVDHGRGNTGDSGGDGRTDRFGGGRRNTTDTRSYQEISYNKYSEHDDRNVEHYEDNRGGDRFKKKWEDRNGAERGNWRDEGRRDDSRRNDDGERGHRFGSGGGDRSDRGERGNRNERGNRYGDGRKSGSGGKKDDNFDDNENKYRGGERKDRFGGGGGEGGGRYGGTRDEDYDKNSDHSSTGDKYGGGGRFGDRGGNRGADRSSGGGGGGRKFGGDYDNKFGGERKFGDRGDRKFGGDRGDKFGGDRGDKFGGDRGDKFGGDRGERKFGGDRGDKFGGRSRDQGDNRSGGGGRRNNEKRSFDNSSKSRDYQNLTSPAIAETTDDWEIKEDAKTSSTAVSAPVVREFSSLNIVAGESYDVYFCEMGNDPNDIYVQMDGSNVLLDDLRAQIDLEEAALLSNGKRAVAKELITPGLPVLARFADDNLLYRGVVRSQVAGTVTVLFVDYGNYGQVPLTDLYTVTPALATKPIQALRVMLNDIKPVSKSGKWETDQSVYLPYYDADNVLKLKVDVLKSIDGEIVSVGSLTRIDGKTVSEKLIEDGLAKSVCEAPCPISTKEKSIPEKLTQETEWDIKVDHLVGQILNAKVTKVIDNKTFMLKIYSLDKNVECQLDDDRTLSNIPVDSNVIISVSSYKDNRLLIKLYDEQGKQLGESASGSTASSICPICPMPVVKQTTLVYVSYFKDQTIFIQSSSMSDEIAIFLEKLFERYNTSEIDESKEWKTGMLCCAASEDGNWYRARIIEKYNEKYTVLFIDYGNTETVDKKQLRELDSEFLKLPEYSLGVHLPVEWLVKESPFMKYVENEELICTFLKNTFGTWIVDLKFNTTGERLVKKLVDESIVKEKEVVSEVEKVAVNSFTVGSSVPVIVSHVDTPTMFWVHLCNDVNTIEELQQKLQDCVDSRPTPKENSKVFAAQYSEDGMWYRAVATGEADTVRFIDYGNTDAAPLRKELPADLLNPLEGYAILMYLCVKPVADNWSDEAIKMFEAFIDQAITAEIKIVGEKIIVDLKSDDRYISKLLVEGNHATYLEESVAIPQELEYPTLYDVVVLTFSDVNNFYVQLISDQEKQLDMIYNLGSAEKYEQITELILGDLVATKSMIDEQWYRGVITSVDPPQAFFIDYGIMLNITDYRTLPDSLKALPPMAIHCSLGLENHQSYTEKFAIMTNDASRIFRLMYKIIDEPNIVDLQLEDGVGLSELLTAIEGPYLKQEVDPKAKPTVKEADETTKVIENCIVCHANGPYDFYIHNPSSQGLSEDLIEKMADAASFPKKEKLEKGDLVAVISNDDEAWYRCKIVDLEPEICGCFIDYGNATFVTEYRDLPEALKSIEPLAIKCSLQLPDGIGGWSAEAVLTFTELVNENLHGFNVILISEGDPWVVELIVNDHNQTKVTEELLKLCPAATPVQSKPATRATTPIALDLDQSKSDQDEQQFDTAPCTPLFGHCYVTHVNSPTDFFVRDTNTSTNLEQVALALAELENNPMPEPHNIDDLVVAQVDGEYFRAKIIEVNPLKVSLIDVGNTSETSDLIQVPESIKNIPPTVKNCSLHIPDEHKIILNNKKAEEEFMSITASNVEFTYKMLSEGERPEVELSLNGENIVHVLSEHLNKTEPTSVTSETKQSKNNHLPALKLNSPIKVTIPYVKSLEEFYIQEISPENDLLADRLNQADIFNSCKSLNIGDLVAACSLEDCVWYRAEIINTNPIEVFFVDFGNISVVEEVKELPEDISKIPYRSVLAKLVRPEGVTEWNEEANNKFSAICEVTFEFDCTVIAENGDKPYTVQLSLSNLGDLSKALSSYRKVECTGTDEPEKQNTSDTVSDVATVQEVKTEGQKVDEEHFQNGNEEGTKILQNQDDFDITQEISEPRSVDVTLTEQIIVETEEDIDYSLNKSETNSSLNKSETNSSTSISNKNDETSKKGRTPLKVKSVAEIKATAKPRIVTRSLSATPLKTGRSTPSPVHKASKTPVDKKKSSESSSGSQLRRSVSFEDKIIPGCVSGNLAK